MFQIECPHCGKRELTEFSYGGEAHLSRPTPIESEDSQVWADYLFNRSNKRGVHYERWFHVLGCRKWFNVARDTITNKSFDTYLPGEKPQVDERAKP
ncbi:MAG: sarcosine oxidase subunit delta [Gammaproteobacteria bacterium]|nr:sarcosine oxidase subunit delta [Gammaproteobacteria bacterium]